MAMLELAAKALQPIADFAWNATRREPKAMAQSNGDYANVPLWQALQTQLDELQTRFRAPAVSKQAAMQVSMVYACCRIISGAVAGMPVQIFAEQNGRKVRDAQKRPIELLLNKRPSATWNAASFWEYMTTSMLLDGQGYAYIERDSFANPIALHPLPPESVFPERDPDFGIVYNVSQNAKDANPQSVVVPWANMLVFHNYGYDGLKAPSMLQTGLRNPLWLANEQDRFARETWVKGALQQFAVTKEGDWSPEDIKGFLELWRDTYGKGSDSSDLPIAFPKSTAITRLSVSLEDSQLLQSREYSLDEISRAFSLPAFLVGRETKNTSFGAGIAEIGNYFARYSLAPHVRRMEDECDRKLVFGDSYVKFNMDGLLRPTTEKRYATYQTALASGLMTINEARELEDLPKLEDPKYDLPFAGPTAPQPAAQDGEQQ